MDIASQLVQDKVDGSRHNQTTGDNIATLTRLNNSEHLFRTAANEAQSQLHQEAYSKKDARAELQPI